MPEVQYYDAKLKRLPADTPADKIAFSDYIISIKPGILYQPHPAFAKKSDGSYRYHALNADVLKDINRLADFKERDTRELTADDYVYNIKQLASTSAFADSWLDE